MSVEAQTRGATRLFGNTETAGNEGNSRPLIPAKYWGNVGIPMTVKDPETGEMVETFLSLPLGLALDTMRPVKVIQNPKTPAQKRLQLMQMAKNQFHQQLLAACAGLDAGEGRILDNVKFQIQAVNDAYEAPEGTDTESNPFADALANLFAAAA